jgi:hypothetical protein
MGSSRLLTVVDDFRVMILKLYCQKLGERGDLRDWVLGSGLTFLEDCEILGSLVS